MKRLVVTGLPCPPEVWSDFLGPKKDQKIISFYDVLENSPSSDLRVMSKYVTAQIEKFKPGSIVAHDLGVPLVLLSLLRLRKKKSPLQPKLTLFNGAFRKVSLVKANHPIRVQFMTKNRAVKEVEKVGGMVDPRLKKHLAKIRAMYRYIILFELAEKVTSALGIDELLGMPEKFPLKSPVQIIASKNDPFIPWDSIEQLSRDCSARRFIEVDYGHFPYSIDPKELIPKIEEFEAATV